MHMYTEPFHIQCFITIIIMIIIIVIIIIIIINNSIEVFLHGNIVSVILANVTKKQTMYIMDLKTVKTANLKYINTVSNLG